MAIGPKKIPRNYLEKQTDKNCEPQIFYFPNEAINPVSLPKWGTMIGSITARLFSLKGVKTMDTWQLEMCPVRDVLLQMVRWRS